MKYKVSFFYNPIKHSFPVRNYLNQLSVAQKAKVLKFIDFLAEHEGYLDEPYSKHIRGKIRELRIDFGNNRHRILYFTFVNQNIILLHAFLKKTPKTPEREIEIAEENYKQVLKERELYE